MQIRSLKSWFGQNLKKSIFCKFVFSLFFDFWAVFQGPGVSKSNAAWKNTPGVLSWDFFARWEARTAPRNPPWGSPLGAPLGAPRGKKITSSSIGPHGAPGVRGSWGEVEGGWGRTPKNWFFEAKSSFGRKVLTGNFSFCAFWVVFQFFRQIFFNFFDSWQIFQ